MSLLLWNGHAGFAVHPSNSHAVLNGMRQRRSSRGLFVVDCGRQGAQAQF
jgi:hypothetical protein